MSPQKGNALVNHALQCIIQCMEGIDAMCVASAAQKPTHVTADELAAATLAGVRKTAARKLQEASFGSEVSTMSCHRELLG